MRLRALAFAGLAMLAFASRGDQANPAARVVGKIPARPRVLARAADFDRLKALAKKSPRAKAGVGKIVAGADAVLGFPLPAHELEGWRLLAVSQRVLHHLSACAFAYRVTGERKYARRAIDEALAVADFKDWNPRHFLDVAEMTLAVAIAYDWTHDVQTPDEREKLAAALRGKGLCGPNGRLHDGWWVKMSNNWGQVCHAGMLAGALAIADTDRALAEQVLVRAVENLPRPMKAYAGGFFPEGPGYWGYATCFNCIAFDLIETLAGSTCGLENEPGFREQVDFMDLMTGPSGYTFNFADAGISPDQQSVAWRKVSPAVWWMARRYGRADALVRFEIPCFDRWAADRTPPDPQARRSGGRLDALMMLWFQEPSAGVRAKAPLVKAFDGLVSVGIQRSSWNPDAWFVGFKAGTLRAPHGHMDIGSFVLDAKGVRWAVDLGSEDYHLLENAWGQNIWNQEANSPRWTAFRLGAKSHNLLLVDGKALDVDGRAVVRVVKDAKRGAGSVVEADLRELHPELASYVRRSEVKSDGCRIVDRLETKSRVTCRWQMVTLAAVKRADGNVLTLERDGKTLVMTAPKGAVWRVDDVSAAPSDHESPNPGLRQVFFELPAEGKLEIAVDMS